MAEHDRVPPPPIEEYLRVTQQFRRLSKRMERWRRDYYLSLKPPEKTLKLEKAKLDTKIRRARADARSCVQSPKLLDRHERALERLIGYADRRRALEPECGCKDRERKETYDSQVKECAQKFPVPNAFIPEDVVAELPPSLTLSPYTTSSERGRSPPLSDEPADSYRDNSPSVPVSPQPSASLPPEVPGGSVAHGPARENDHQDRRTERASEAVRSPHTAGDSNSAGGEVVTKGTATIASPEQGRTNKRRLMCNSRAPLKRARLEASNEVTSTALDNNDGTEAEPHHEAESENNDEAESEYNDEPDFEYQDEDESESNSDDQACSSANSNRDSNAQPGPRSGKSKRPEPRAASQKTIEFSEVYRDGKPKHHIADYKGKWYILRCDTHGMHFGDKPIKGAAKHLSADTHNNQTREYRLAIDLLGIEVLNCDAEGQRISNEAFSRALDDGYQPLGNPPAARIRPQTRRQLTATSARGRSQRSIDEAVLDPAPGGIYMALWTGSDRVGVIVIPRGCFGDPSFAEVGLPGSSLADDTVLMDNVPECYVFCPVTRSILGWAPGYEDGGDRVAERQYPVMYFDGVDTLRKNSVAWLSVKDLRVYDREGCARHKALISNYPRLRQFEAQREKAREAALSATRQPEEEPAAIFARQQEEEEEPEAAAAASQQEAPAEGDDSPSEDTEPDLSEFNVSPPPGQPAETTQPAPETSGSYNFATDSLHQGHTAPVTYEQRNSERHSAISYWPRHLGTLPPSYLGNPAHLQVNIVGHAVHRENGEPPSSHAMEAPGSLTRDSGEGMANALRGTASAALKHNRGIYNSAGGESAALVGLTNSSTGSVGPPEMAREPAERPCTPRTPRTAGTALPAERPGLGPVSAGACRGKDRSSERTLAMQGASCGHAKTAAQPVSIIPSRNTPPRPEPCRVQLGTTYDAPIDIDGWDPPRTPRRHEPQTTLPGFSSFKQPFEDRPPTIHCPQNQSGHWTVSQGPTVSRGHYHPNSGTPSTGSASRAALVPEATMSPVVGGFNFDRFIHEDGLTGP